MVTSKAKKVLIISYYWPPAGGPGVQRWLKFVKYLPSFNIDPIVYVPSNPSYPITDDSLISEIPADITIIKKPIKEPYGLAKMLSGGRSRTISKGIISQKTNQSYIEKLMLYIRGNFFIPDARKSWVKPSIDFLNDYLSENDIKAIITTGPPHSMHLIGLGLKKKFKIHWLADFRDPWTTIGYHKKLKLSETSKKKHLKLEKEVLNTADQIIVTSQNTKLELRTKTKVPIEVITNGYDSHSLARPEKFAGFVMAHIGSLLSERNPKILWKVLSKLVADNKDFAKNFKLKLAGVVSEDVIASLKHYKLMQHVELLDYISHKEALTLQMASDVLLLIEIDSNDTKAIIPGKLFEYMQSGTPILAIGPQGSDIEKIILETNTGKYFNYQNELEIQKLILEYFDKYKSGSLRTNPLNITKYSRENLTKQLADLL